VSKYECADCWLAACDLPDGFDPEFVFERGDDGVMRCQGCASIVEANRRWEAGDW
jgi:hypothetical protein